MSAVREHPDGDLPAAIGRLATAIEALIEPQQQFIEGHHRYGPSLYMQLWDASPSEQISGRRELSATAVTWIDALQLRIEIDTRVEIEQPAFSGVPPTVARLKLIGERKWKPEQTRYVDNFADAIDQWVKEIAELLNPQPQWTLPNPCPACGVAVVYRKDAAGDRVRKPALQIGPGGCQCLNCRYMWEPYRFRILAEALNCPLPDGVLE